MRHSKEVATIHSTLIEVAASIAAAPGCAHTAGGRELLFMPWVPWEGKEQ